MLSTESFPLAFSSLPVLFSFIETLLLDRTDFYTHQRLYSLPSPIAAIRINTFSNRVTTTLELPDSLPERLDRLLLPRPFSESSKAALLSNFF